MAPRKDGTLSRKGDTLSRNKEGTLSRNKEGTLSRQNKGDTLSRQGKGEGTLGRKGILKTANNAAAAPTANPGLSFFFPCLLFFLPLFVVCSPAPLGNMVKGGELASEN